MKKIKQLQNNFTTPEQSKRLLKLGVPADSADCYLDGNSVIMLNNKTFQENYDEDLELARLHLIEYPQYTPCWLVGRLIEIHAICAGASSSYYIHAFPTNIMNEVMWHLTEAIRNGWIDFSKLEG